MNLDLLKKLTRLANNNPNENEENLAARRVCKMLEEGKFSLPIEGPKISGASTPYGPRKPWSAYDPKTSSANWQTNAEEVKRAQERAKQAEKVRYAEEVRQEQEWKATEEERKWKGGPTSDEIFEDMRRKYEEFLRDPRIHYSKPYTSKPPPNPFDWAKGNIIFDYETKPTPEEAARKHSQQEKRPLECTRCHNKIETAFVGPPQVYVCNGCIWKDWMASR